MTSHSLSSASIRVCGRVTISRLTTFTPGPNKCRWCGSDKEGARACHKAHNTGSECCRGFPDRAESIGQAQAGASSPIARLENEATAFLRECCVEVRLPVANKVWAAGSNHGGRAKGRFRYQGPDSIGKGRFQFRGGNGPEHIRALASASWLALEPRPHREGALPSNRPGCNRRC